MAMSTTMSAIRKAVLLFCLILPALGSAAIASTVIPNFDEVSKDDFAQVLSDNGISVEIKSETISMNGLDIQVPSGSLFLRFDDNQEGSGFTMLVSFEISTKYGYGYTVFLAKFPSTQRMNEYVEYWQGLPDNEFGRKIEQENDHRLDPSGLTGLFVSRDNLPGWAGLD